MLRANGREDANWSSFRLCKKLSKVLSRFQIGRDIVADIYSDDQRITPPNRTARYTRVEIALYAGRSMDAKRALYKAIVENFGRLGIPEGDIKTILLEFPLEDCAPRGPLAASDADDLGYKVMV